MTYVKMQGRLQLAAFALSAILAPATALAVKDSEPTFEPEFTLDARDAQYNPPFTKTIGYTYSTHTNVLPSCGTSIYYKYNVPCPTGCALMKLVYDKVATTPYECKPTAMATSVAAFPIVAAMSCSDSNGDFTTIVTPAYGAAYTTCVNANSGNIHYATPVTVLVSTITTGPTTTSTPAAPPASPTTSATPTSTVDTFDDSPDMDWG